MNIPLRLYPLGVTLDGVRVNKFGIIRANTKAGYVSLASEIPGRKPGHTEYPKSSDYLHAFAQLGSGYFPPIRHYYYGEVIIVDSEGTPLNGDIEGLLGIPE